MIFKTRVRTHCATLTRLQVVVVTMVLSIMTSKACRTLAAEPQAIDSQGTYELRQDAVRRIPMQAMTSEAQIKIQSVIDSPTYFRRMPQRTIECDGQLFKQFVRYPEILIGVWDTMGATKVQIQRTAPYLFDADDGAGTRCNSELLYGNENVHVYYSTGDYTGKLVPRKIDGRSVCIVHSASTKTEDGRQLVTAHLDVFLKLDNLGADLIVRTIGPMMGSTADQNYFETMNFLSQLSDASLNNPFGVRGLVERIRFVQPTVKEKFIGEVYLAADRAAKIASMQETATKIDR